MCRRTARARSWVVPILGVALATALAGCRTQAEAPRNVLMVVIDTLRADHLHCYGYPRETSPNIDALADRGVRFERAYSTATYTRASTASILTGHYPSVHKAVTFRDSLSPEIQTLPGVLSEAGYRTVGIYLNRNIAPEFGFGRGFGRYEHPGAEYRQLMGALGDPTSLPTGDRAVTRRAVSFLRRIGEIPFFLYLHYVAPHDPYVPPQESISFLDEELAPELELFYQQPVKLERGERTVLQQLDRGELSLDAEVRDQIIDLYDGEVAFSDLQVGEVVRALDEAGLFEDTLVILTSDHGEEFWDHGGAGHGGSHYDELLHVPLVITGPGLLPGAVATPVGLIDLVPTVLDLLGLDAPSSLPGRSLGTALRSRSESPVRRPVFAESFNRNSEVGDPRFFRSIQLDDLKLVLDFQKHRKHLYDLETDPGEEIDVIDERPQRARALLDELEARHRANLEMGSTLPHSEAIVSGETEKELRALGYVSVASPSPRLGARFYQELEVPDLDSYGSVGLDRDVSRFRSALERPFAEFPEEQLLYGWKPLKKGFAPMSRRAGIVLARTPDQERWRLVGRLRGLEGEVLVRVRVDGAAEALENTVSIEEAGGLIELAGNLPEPRRSVVRFDLECVGGGRPRGESHRVPEHAPCAFVRFFGLE